MGSVHKWARGLGVAARAIASASDDIDLVTSRVVDIEQHKSSDYLLRSLGALVSKSLSVCFLFITCFYIRFVGNSVLSQLESGDASVSLAVYTTLVNTIGYLCAVVFSYAIISEAKQLVNEWIANRDKTLASKEQILRRTVLKMVIRSVCSAYDVVAPQQLSLDEYADAVINNVGNITTILGPVIAILWPHWAGFFRFSSAWSFLRTARDGVYGFVARIYHGVCGMSKTKRFAIAATLAASIGAAVFLWKFTAPKRKRKLRVVQKRHQRVYPGTAPVVPIDPSELNFTPGVLSPGFTQIRTFPEYPTFDGVTTVHGSLVRINGLYGATAFRCGQNLVTAGHCIGVDPKYSEKGIPCYNPDDKKVYWAPLEKYFKNNYPNLGGDGIAICSLPNADYFLTRHSCQLAVPNKNLAHAGSFRLQGIEGHPKFTFSMGPCSVEDSVILFKSSVEPGSSGGPIINQDGTTVGVVVAHTDYTNIGMVITQDLVDFLTKPGGAVRGSLDPTCQDQSLDEYTSTENSSESSESEEEIQINVGGGQTPGGKKKQKRSRNSRGPTKSDEASTRRAAAARRKAKPRKPQVPDPETPVEYNATPIIHSPPLAVPTPSA